MSSREMSIVGGFTPAGKCPQLLSSLARPAGRFCDDDAALRCLRQRGSAGASCVPGSARARAGADARLTARPRDGAQTSLTSGPLGLGDCGVTASSRCRRARPPARCRCSSSCTAPRRAARDAAPHRPAADHAGVAVLAPDSRGTTWDAIRDDFGDDVTFLNRALEFVFARLHVDPARVAVGGFSDGASYALSLGLANGDLFPRIVACLARFRRPGAAARPSALLHLARHRRSDPADRSVQPGHRAAAALARLRRDVPRVRGPPRAAARHCRRSGALGQRLTSSRPDCFRRASPFGP